MRINKLLSATSVCVGTIACGLASYVAWQQYTRLQTADRAQIRLGAMQALADVPRFLNVQRGLSTIALQTLMDSDTAKLVPLSNQRAATERAFVVAHARIDAAVGKLPDAGELATVLADMERMYRGVLGMMETRLAQPLDQRGDAVAVVTRDLTLVTGFASRAMSEQLRGLASLNGAAFRWGSTASAAIDLRDQAGRQAQLLQNFVGDRKPLRAHPGS